MIILFLIYIIIMFKLNICIYNIFQEPKKLLHNKKFLNF